MNLKKFLFGASAITVAVAALVFSQSRKADGQTSPVNNYFTAQPAIYSLQTNQTPVYGGAGWTNYLQGSTAFENDTPIDTAGAKDVALQFRFQCRAANAAAITVALGRNNDRSMGTTNIELFTAFAATANGNNVVTINTNLSTANGLWGGYRYLYIMYITNAAAATGAITNYSIVPWLK